MSCILWDFSYNKSEKAHAVNEPASNQKSLYKGEVTLRTGSTSEITTLRFVI